MVKPVVLCILDGFALIDENRGNAVNQANKPNIDRLLKQYPHTKIMAAGMDVGLPEGQMGNSEVGHLNIGAGRIVYQSLTLINKAVQDGTFFENKVFLNAMSAVKEKQTKLHIMGLLSDGGVHSSLDHIKALLKLAKDQGLTKVYVHAFLDGRDVAPDSGASFVSEIQDAMKEIGVGELATISGRYYAMDRDKRFERVELATNAMIEGNGPSFEDGASYVKSSYENNVYDEFVIPGVHAGVDGRIQDGDGVIFANFRPDRAIQLASALTNPDYIWVPANQPKNLTFVCMMKYADTVRGEIAFALPKLENTLGDYLAANNKKQLRIAETEKYAHVTFFFDGGLDKELPGAKRILVNSPKVATYDLQPEMSAIEVTDKLIESLKQDDLDVVILNFANCDMVGHTGIMSAAIKAVETVDACVGRIYDQVESMGGGLLVTADHGNSEQLEDENGNPFTAHTTNPVPFIVCVKDVTLKEGGRLADIAPTILKLVGLDQPTEMTGESLIK